MSTLPGRVVAARRGAAALLAASLPLAALTAAAALALSAAPAPAYAQHTDGEMDAEHNAMLDLVPTASATHTAVANGNWNAGSTWNTGTVPGAGARVVIPAGRTVTYDVSSAPNIQWVRVAGILTFSRSVSTAMNVDTIVVDVGGEWDQGTASSPIPSNLTSTITFTDTGALSTSTDPYLMGRGLLSHGRIRIHGATVTPYVKTNAGLGAGATSVTLQSTPTGWKNGDQIVVTGQKMKNVRNPVTTYFDPTPTDELKAISSISGATVGLNSGLVDARVVEYGNFGLYPFVVNHTRNVTFRSANASDPSRRGHVMIMHNRAADIRYAAFHSLGRTRKDIDVTNGATAALPSGSNPRARYALHFHRTGKDDNTVVPSYVVGCSVLNPTAWGYVNHDSFVVFEDNVCHNAFGSAFITENGGEIGTFRRNLASTTRGRGFIKDGVSNHDLARNGSAFWFQGGNVTVENNVATGANQGFSYFQRSGVNLGNSTVIQARNLIDGQAAGGNPTLQSADTPIMSFLNNTALGCYEGFHSVDTEINGIWPTNSVIEGFTDLNSFGYKALEMEYYRNLTFKNVKIVRDSTLPSDSQYGGVFAIVANALVDHQYPWATRASDRHDGVYIRGYWNGIDNHSSDLGVSNGTPERAAKHDVINSSIDFVGPGSVFRDTGTLLGQPLVKYVSSADVLPFPNFSPAAGSYTGAQTVTISSPVSGATIYYVVGNAGYMSPSLESRLQPGQWTQYTGPVTISGTQKLIAMLVRNGHYGRARNGVYTIQQGTAAPTFSPAPGTYTSAQSVTLASGTSGATIRYTTDGSTPTSTSGAVYSGPINVSATTTIRAVATSSGRADSSVSAGTYTIGTVTNPGTPVTLQNPGYETGNLTGWLGGGSARGVNAASARTGSFGFYNNGAWNSIYQDVAVQANSSYTLRVWARLTTAASNSQHSLWYSLNGGSTKNRTTISGTGWTQYTINFTTGATQTSVRIGQEEFSGTNVVAQVDDWTLTKN